jgi:hypothetical protein
MIYLALTLITLTLGLISMLFKRVTIFSSERPLDYDKHAIRWQPAFVVGRAFAIFGLVFSLDALRVMTWGGRGFLWAFCCGWVLLAIVSNLYLSEFFDRPKR